MHSSMARATSSGSPACSSDAAARAGSAARAAAYREPETSGRSASRSAIGVRNRPGATTVTKIPNSCTSASSTALALANAALLAEYQPPNDAGIRPPPEACMTGTAAAASRIGPNRFTPRRPRPPRRASRRPAGRPAPGSGAVHLMARSGQAPHRGQANSAAAASNRTTDMERT
ncbi:MAG TPA: hypothetical protein VK586_27625 [Streptosporangiaceae bacterium]|nr:hypothetical protein [Streptosporangiaceae bacterium]